MVLNPDFIKLSTMENLGEMWLGMFIMRIRVCVSLYLKTRCGGRKLPQI